jgi:hypothetical protein
MAITFPTQYDPGDARNDVPMLSQANTVPITSQDSEDAWTLNLMTIDWPAGPGHVEGGAVAVGASAERYIPGIIDGHLYKMTVHLSASMDRLEITLGEIAVGHIGNTGSGVVETKVFYVRPTSGNHLLKFEHAAGTNFTGAVEIVAFEAQDPMNLDIVPEITIREV